MNWKQIKEKYPKAFDKYIDWCHAEDCPSIDCYSHNDRDAYDFFDEQGIYITVNTESYFGGWIYYIEDKEHQIIGDDGYYDYKTRTEAEEKAFEEAFEILEGRIK
jgi:hypothetical protein